MTRRLEPAKYAARLPAMNVLPTPPFPPVAIFMSCISCPSCKIFGQIDYCFGEPAVPAGQGWMEKNALAFFDLP